MNTFRKNLKLDFGQMNLNVEIDGDAEFSFEIHPEDGYLQADLKIHSKDPFKLKKFSLKASVPIIDVHGISVPGILDNVYSFIIPWHFEDEVAPHRGFPFISFINRRGSNRLAVGLRDSSLGYRITENFIEKTEELEVIFENLNVFEGTSFENSLFVSNLDENWFEIAGIYSKFSSSSVPKFPDYMYEPVYCTWYAFYQNLNQDYLNRIAERASDLGFKIFIVDDGWFTSDNSRGYWYTGDWEVCEEKFPDFKEHVRVVKSRGLKYVLWIAPFMVGMRSKAFRDFEKLLVSKRERLGYANLCPQSKAVRDRILEVLERLLVEYDLDGFKLDFLDDLPVKSCKGDHDHFTDNPSLALKEILSDILNLGRKLGKDLIIEMRQRYASPQMIGYTTAFRAADTPFDFDQNRRRILTLRSFSGVTPVYSDPIVWRSGENADNISRHFMSSIYSVPMVSMDLLKLSREEEKLIRFWLNFHRNLRDVLLLGDLKVRFSNGEITKACSVKDDVGVCSLYSEGYVNIDEFGEFGDLYILNSSNDDRVVITSENMRGKYILFTIESTTGRIEERRLFEGVMVVPLPPSKVMHLRREGS